MTLDAYLKLTRTSQSDFAKLLGCQQSTVHRWLSGRSDPRPLTQLRIERLTQGAVPTSVWLLKYEGAA